MESAAALAPEAAAAAVARLLGGAGQQQHLVRERALTQLQQLLDEPGMADDPALLAALHEGVAALLLSDDWGQRLGALRVAHVLLLRGHPDPAFAALMGQACCDLLEDPEVRVRWAVGEVFRVLAEQEGVEGWERARERVMGSIRENIDRDAADPSASSRDPAGGSEMEDSSSNSSPDFLASLLQHSYRVERPGQGEMRHGTEGWKCLETSFRALQHLMEGCGTPFRPYLDAELRQLIYQSQLHPNRFVREVCHYIAGTMCRLLGPDVLQSQAPELALRLGYGLSDNWSQVRYAASVATRAFMLAAEPFRAQVLPLLLPQMCLNRYYVAEGVRAYSQARETWQLVLGESGREWVARCAPAVVSYYVEQSKADNHAVREAACECMGELLAKVDREAVLPHVPRLLRALLSCFRDASWPVRDAACLACGAAVRAFPAECRESLEKLYALWFAHLWDNIQSVREDSAVALGDAIRAYGPEAAARVVAQVREVLPRAREQPPDSKKFVEVVPPAGRVASAEQAAQQALFSGGSLSAKLQRSRDCCIDGGFVREKEPWEATDGAVYMENIWRQLPAIAQHLGKRQFKPFLEDFLEPLFRSLTCGHRLCEAAAGRCIGALRDFIGPGIFAGRLTERQRQLMQQSPEVPPPAGRFAMLGAQVTPDFVLRGQRSSS
eukprot:scaffold2.g7146.t1